MRASDKLRLTQVSKEMVPTFWPLVAHWIKRSIERGDMGLYDTVYPSLVSGEATLWVVSDYGLVPVAAGVTCVDVTENTRALVIYAYSGEGHWEAMLGPVVRHAKKLGCNAIRIYGRRGWEKVLKGYKPIRTVYERRLDNER